MQTPGGNRPEEPGNLTYPWRYNARRARDKKGDKMVKIVHWKDIVGQENLEVFTRIEKAIVFAERIGQSAENVIARMKDKQDELEMWREKRHFLRKCGYDDNGKSYGWYKAYLDYKNDELRFKATAPPDRKYISLREYLEYRQKREQDAYEAEYYQEYSSILSDLCSDKGKCQTDDDVFVHEE